MKDEFQMICFASVRWLFLLPLSSVLFAQPACPDRPPPYQLLRQDEDYRYLKDPACQVDFWDRLKYVPFGSDADRFLVVGGEVREWYESFRNASWGRGTQDGNGYLLQRLTLHADVHAAPRVRFFVQLTSDIQAGRNGGPRPVIDESRLFLEQSFVDLALFRTRKKSMTLRVGRQEFRFGSGRFVDVREGPNVRQAFDGVSLKWETCSWTIDGFAVKPVRNGAAVFDAPPNPRSTFWGTYAVHPLKSVKGANVDLYYLGLARKNAVFERGSHNELRHTAGTRLWGGTRGWSYNSEAMLQWGTFGPRGIRAWAATVDASYTFRKSVLRPQIGIDAGVASGDRGDAQPALGTFNPLFPTGIYFGQAPLGLNGPINLILFGPRIRLQLAKRVAITVEDHTFWRKSLQDGVYGLAANLLIPGRDNPHRYIGNQPTAGIQWAASRHLSFAVSYGHFFAGSFIKHASPAGKNVRYAGISTTYKF